MKLFNITCFPVFQEVRIYFIASYVIGILAISVLEILGFNATWVFLLILNSINILVNAVLILSFVVMIFIKQEKRIERFNSMFLLFFNFPFTIWIYVSLIYNH